MKTAKERQAALDGTSTTALLKRWVTLDAVDDRMRAEIYAATQAVQAKYEQQIAELYDVRAVLRERILPDDYQGTERQTRSRFMRAMREAA